MWLTDLSGAEPGVPMELAPDIGDLSYSDAKFDPDTDLFGVEIVEQIEAVELRRSVRVHSRADLDTPIVEVGQDVRGWYVLPAR